MGSICKVEIVFGIMSGDWSDFCECFFARMRSNVQQFQNILSNNRDSYYNGPNGGTPDGVYYIISIFFVN